MKILTKYFGKIDIEKSEIIHFPLGIIGFENNLDFVLIRFDPEDDTLFCLQSTDEPGLGFILMSPYAIDAEYPVCIQDYEAEEIETEADTPAELYVIAVIKDDIKQCTVNLRCPIVVNCEKRLAKQVVLNGSNYSLRQPIVAGSK